jgi:hypothetical protein
MLTRPSQPTYSHLGKIGLGASGDTAGDQAVVVSSARRRARPVPSGRNLAH